MALLIFRSRKPSSNSNLCLSSIYLFSSYSHHQGAQDSALKQQDGNQISADFNPPVTNHLYWTKRIHELCTVDRDVDSALNLLHRLSFHGYRLNALNINSIIHALCDSNRFDQAHQKVSLFIRSYPCILDERTCNVLIGRLLDGVSPDSTLSVIGEMINANPYFVPSLVNYNRLIHLFGNSSNVYQAHRLFWEMERKGHVIGVVSYTSLIEGYCKVGEMGVANRLFDEMRGRGVKPNALTVSVLIRGTFRKRDVEKGGLLMQMLWEVMASEEDKQVNNAAFSNVVDCLCREGLFHEVFKITEDMPQGKNVLEEFAYAEMISSLCKYGRYNGGARIVYMMRNRGIIPNLMSYNVIVHGLCLEGDWFRSFQLLQEGIGIGYVPSEYTFKHLVEGLCRENDLFKAKEVLSIMLKCSEAGKRTRIYNIYLRALCLMSNQSELLNVLVMMLQTQCQPDIITMNTVLKGLCKMGRIEEALKVLKDMRMGLFCSPDAVTFTTLISGLLEAGKVEEAFHFLINVMPECRITPNLVTYNVVLRGLFNLSMTDKAMEMFYSMESRGVVADCATYSIIISGLCNSGQIDEAKRLWDDVIWPSKVHDNFVYSAILKGLCSSGKFTEAWDFLYELADCGVTLNNVNYNIVIDAACKLGLRREAYQIMGEMRKNGLTPDSVTWRILNKFQSDVGNHAGDDLKFECGSMMRRALRIISQCTIVCPESEPALRELASTGTSMSSLPRIINHQAKSMAAEKTNGVTNSKASVYLQDMNEVQQVFQRFDVNKDGKISSDELASVMKALGSEISDEEICSMIREIDTDNDGYINLEEFAAFCKGESVFGTADDGEKEIHDAFETYDQDRDGFISEIELHQILTRLGERCSVNDCVNMIKSVDSDGDGKVSFEEFRNMMTDSNRPAF